MDKKTLKRILTFSGVSFLTLSTIGFTMFGIGAGGKPTNVNVAVDPSLSLFNNSGFIANKGKLSQAQIDALKALETASQNDPIVKAEYNKIKNFKKEVEDNLLFFNIGIMLFSVSFICLIGVIAYYLMFRKQLTNKEE